MLHKLQLPFNLILDLVCELDFHVGALAVSQFPLPRFGKFIDVLCGACSRQNLLEGGLSQPFRLVQCDAIKNFVLHFLPLVYEEYFIFALCFSSGKDNNKIDIKSLEKYNFRK